MVFHSGLPGWERIFLCDVERNSHREGTPAQPKSLSFGMPFRISATGFASHGGKEWLLNKF